MRSGAGGFPAAPGTRRRARRAGHGDRQCARRALGSAIVNAAGVGAHNLPRLDRLLSGGFAAAFFESDPGFMVWFEHQPDRFSNSPRTFVDYLAAHERGRGPDAPQPAEPAGVPISPDPRDAFEALYRSARADLLPHLVRRTSDAGEAADLLAETYAKAWRKLEAIPAGDQAQGHGDIPQRRPRPPLPRPQAARVPPRCPRRRRTDADAVVRSRAPVIDS